MLFIIVFPELRQLLMSFWLYVLHKLSNDVNKCIHFL